MPADDIVVKKVPAMGVVVIAGEAPAFGPAGVVPVVDRPGRKVRAAGDGDRIKDSGPRMILYDAHEREQYTVYLAQPVTEPAGRAGEAGPVPRPARDRGRRRVRSGPAASIFPVVYHDLIQWIDQRGYRAVIGSNREVWVDEVDDIADVAQQVFEIRCRSPVPAPRPRISHGTPNSSRPSRSAATCGLAEQCAMCAPAAHAAPGPANRAAGRRG